MSGTPLTAALITRLRLSNVIDANDARAIEGLPIRGRFCASHQPIVEDGDRPSDCCLLVDGYLARSKSIGDGRRQILSIHIASEIPDLHSLFREVMDHDLTTLKGSTLGFIPHTSLRQLCAARPNVAAALWRETLADAAIFREWIVNTGRRSAPERMAHFILEMWTRLDQIGRTHDGSFELPMTQGELADCLGLTTVHVNRVLQQLRRDNLLEVSRKECRILDVDRLAELCHFDASYLNQSHAA